MAVPAPLVSSAYALGTVCSWGVSDFIGGYTARRFQAFFLVSLGHLSGTALVGSLALAKHESFPPISHFAWACAGGTAGGISLALFYRALSRGRMGLAAPISAVLSAAIPTAFGILTQGLPRALTLIGFVLAVVGIWLISRPENGGRPEGLGLALIAGIGFAAFYICMQQAGSGAALWLATGSRASALLVTAIVVVSGNKFAPSYPGGFLLGPVAGCIDVTGTFLFIRATQVGRLDTAVILSSLYPAITVLLARLILKERFTAWKVVGVLAALAAVPMIAAS
jgi:drug/metabolite transporter (DMT)-like permease